MAAVALVMLSASPAGAAPTTSDKLAAKLQKAGLGCEDFAAEEPNGAAGATPTSEGECTVEGEKLQFHTYKDSDVTKNALGIATTLGCAVSKGLGRSNIPFIVGKTWTITAESKGTAKHVAKALKAKAITICKD